jgi:RNA polymerase sigma-70 factor, ECF subfamily
MGKLFSQAERVQGTFGVRRAFLDLMTSREKHPMNSLAALWHALKPHRAAEEETEQRKRVAFSGMAAENEAKLLRLARRLCYGDEDRAQDLVQDTLIQGYRAYVNGKFREGTNAGGWLMRILTNDFLMQCRREKHRTEFDLDSLIADGKLLPNSLHANAGDRPDTALLTRTLDEELEQALAALPPEQRACVVLVDMEELSYAEAAQMLAVPIGTVRSRLFRAHEKLAVLLGSDAAQGDTR